MVLVPAEYDLIDIHSHIRDSEDNVFRILNTSTLDFTSIRSTGPVSVGLHPWHIKDEAIENLHTTLETALKLPNVLAVGETGLDRIF